MIRWIITKQLQLLHIDTILVTVFDHLQNEKTYATKRSKWKILKFLISFHLVGFYFFLAINTFFSFNFFFLRNNRDLSMSGLYLYLCIVHHAKAFKKKKNVMHVAGHVVQTIKWIRKILVYKYIEASGNFIFIHFNEMGIKLQLFRLFTNWSNQFKKIFSKLVSFFPKLHFYLNFERKKKQFQLIKKKYVKKNKLHNMTHKYL